MSNSDLILASYGIKPHDVISTTKSKNSKIHKCKNSEGSYVCIKEYLGEAARCLRSMEREIISINFLHQHNFKNIAELISFNKSRPSICYEWIEGSTPESNHFIKNQITDALIALNQLFDFNPNFPLAVDAATSLADLKDQINLRMPDVETYLHNFPNIWKSIKDCQVLNPKKTFLNDIFPINTFSFSDIGTHNMLINSNSKVYFLDFEFFGADSKVKMLADIFAHPRTIFANEEILSLALKLAVSDYEFKQLVGIIPTIAVKWALITSRRLSDKTSNEGDLEAKILEQIMDYLDYSRYLSEISGIDMLLTFPEFKKMQQ